MTELSMYQGRPSFACQSPRCSLTRDFSLNQSRRTGGVFLESKVVSFQGLFLPLLGQAESTGPQGERREEWKEKVRETRDETMLKKRAGTANCNRLLLALQAGRELHPASPRQFLGGNPPAHRREWSTKTGPGNACNATRKYFVPLFKYNPKFLCSSVQSPFCLACLLPVFWECILCL